MKIQKKFYLFAIIALVIVIVLWKTYYVKEYLTESPKNTIQKETVEEKTPSCNLGCAVTVADLMKVQTEISANQKRIEEVRQEAQSNLQKFRNEIDKSTNLL